MLPGEAGINVRKTARYASKDCDPLHPSAKNTDRQHRTKGANYYPPPPERSGRQNAHPKDDCHRAPAKPGASEFAA